jgi:hypothetical protein
MRKEKEPDPDFGLMDPDPGDPKTCRSGSPTLEGRDSNLSIHNAYDTFSPNTATTTPINEKNCGFKTNT